jgi:hypothetical protein
VCGLDHLRAAKLAGAWGGFGVVHHGGQMMRAGVSVADGGWTALILAAMMT